jgi:murein DD-endopeptidase MepM/ murein hydrolase activator NlpD
LRGTFERDGTRHGTFRMMRSGNVGGLKRAATSQSELQQRAQVRRLQGGGAAREEYRNSISEYLVGRGVFLSDEQLDALTDEAIEMLADGVDNAAIGRKLGESATEKFYSFAEDNAEHDDAVRYRLPFDLSVPRKLGAGVGGDVAITSFGAASGYFGHHDWSRYSFDFIMPVSVEVRAARAGVVKRIGGGLVERSRGQGRMTPSTGIYVLHDDGTFAMYAHLQPEVDVEIGERVEVGQRLGEARGPHLHFGIVRLGSKGKLESVEIHFDDGSPRGYVPAMGLYYGGEGED